MTLPQAWLPLTDSNGMFWVRNVAWTLLTFRHPAYATERIGLYADDVPRAPLEVLRSSSAQVRLHVYEADGTPANRLIGQLVGPRKGDWRNGAYVFNVRDQWVTDGTLFFSNVPTQNVPMRAVVLGPMWNTPGLGRSDEFTPQPGTLTDVRIDLPPMGGLAVRTRPPLPGARGKVNAQCIDKDAPGTAKRPYLLRWQGDAWVAERMLTGNYRVTVTLDQAAVASTSVTVHAHVVTALDLPTTRAWG
jgi:hypothetical protein